MQQNPEAAALRAIAKKYRAAAAKFEAAAKDLEGAPSLEISQSLSILHRDGRQEPRRETIVQAAQKILLEAGRPLLVRELVVAYTARLGYSVDRASMSVLLSKNKTIFKLMEGRRWGLVGWHQDATGVLVKKQP